MNQSKPTIAFYFIQCIAVSKKATEVWKTLTPAQRQYWDRKSEEDKQRFFSEKDQYEGPVSVKSKYECLIVSYVFEWSHHLKLHYLYSTTF